VPVIVGAAVLAEAALGFIGLGDGSATSLGRLIADAYPFFALAPWMSLAPVAALAALVLAVQGALS
jgi:ABC-type dipeptide/oligopeptide/nickel transport system permease subunit